MANTFTCTLEAVRSLTSTVKHLRFRMPSGQRLNFQAGHFVISNMPRDGKVYRKPYSIASPPYESDTFELCIKLVEGGYATNYYFKMKAGDQLLFDGPYGKFLLKEPIQNLAFLATGTGIAPFRGMLKQLDHDGKLAGLEVWVLLGVRYEDEILYQDEFEALTKKYAPRFHFYPCISRPRDPAWPTKGYVQQISKQVLTPSTSTDAYICGLVQMVDDMKSALKELGFSDAQIHFEKWT